MPLTFFAASTAGIWSRHWRVGEIHLAMWNDCMILIFWFGLLLRAYATAPSSFELNCDLN
jgi:hypothetical protein